MSSRASFGAVLGIGGRLTRAEAFVPPGPGASQVAGVVPAPRRSPRRGLLLPLPGSGNIATVVLAPLTR